MGSDFCNCSRAHLEMDNNMDHLAKEAASRQSSGRSSMRNNEEEGERSKSSGESPNRRTHGCRGAATSDHEKQLFLPIKCNSIRDCDAFKRVITAIAFYQTLPNVADDKDSQSRLLTYFRDADEDSYSRLLEDYNHVLLHHLGDQRKNISKSRQELELINSMVLRSIRSCALNECDKFTRNYRLRERYSVFGETENLDEDFMIAHDERDDTEEKLIKYYIETLDTVHCFFVHTFHCGYRLKLSDMDATKRNRRRVLRKASKRRPVEEATDTNLLGHQLSTIKEETVSQCLLAEDDATALFVDEQLQKIQTKLIKKQQRFKRILGERYNQNKFTTKIPGYTHEALQNSTAEQSAENRSNDKKQLTFEYDIFGHRFYYWKWYRSSTKRDTFPNEKYNHNEWYIERKYEDLEEEMHDNKVYNLNYERFKEIVFISTHKIKCQHARNLVANNENNDRYGIAPKQSITIQHLQAMLIYTHFGDEFASAFRAALKRQSATETDEELKRRASEFWHFSKLLRETVEVFGMSMEQSKISTFYHNINYKLPFQCMVLYLSVPLSTSINLETATMFSACDEDGIMLEMQKDDEKLKYFDCSWLSCHGNDGERLFYGSVFGVRIKSIRELKTDVNYEYFMHAISIFDYTVSGKIPLSESTRTDLLIIGTLVNQRKDLQDEYDTDMAEEQEEGDVGEHRTHQKYIHDIFYDFCMNKREVRISFWNMSRYYPAMQMLLFYDKRSKKKNLCVFSNLCKIFKNCKQIVIEYYAYSKLEIDEGFLEYLLEELQLIPNEQKRNLLVELVHVKWIQSVLEKYKTVFMAKSWSIEEKEDKVRIYAMHMSVSLFSET